MEIVPLVTGMEDGLGCGWDVSLESGRPVWLEAVGKEAEA